MPRRVLVNNRTVDGVAQPNRSRRLRAFHGKRLLLDFDIFPGAAIAVAVVIGWIERLDVEVLLVDSDGGESPGDVPVMPERDPRQGRLTRADRVPSRSHQVHGLAQRGKLHGAM